MSIVKYTNKNGTVYVYESTPHYDPITKQSRPTRKLIGKIDPQTGEIIPTGKRGRPSKKTISKNNVRKVISYGATYALTGIAKKSGILADVKAVFPQQYQQYLALAYFMTLEPTKAMHKYEKWAVNTATFNEIELPSQCISELFTQISEDHKQDFFRRQQERLKKADFWVYETTSQLTDGQNAFSNWALNQDEDQPQQINHAIVMEQSTQIPVLYQEIENRMMDSKTLQQLTEMFKNLPCEKVNLCLGQELCNEENLQFLLSEGINFVMGGKSQIRYIDNAVTEVIEQIEDPEYYHTGYKLAMKSVSVNESEASEAISHPLSVHVYYDAIWQAEAKHDFLTTLAFVEEALIKHRELGKEYQLYHKFFKEDKNSQHLVRNNALIREHLKTKGIFVLLSNTNLTSEEVLRLYRDKDILEQKFKLDKAQLNLRSVRHYEAETINGYIFVQFISLLLELHIRENLRTHQLDKRYTVSDVLEELKEIYVYLDGQGKYHVAEITKDQEELLQCLEMPIPGEVNSI